VPATQAYWDRVVDGGTGLLTVRVADAAGAWHWLEAWAAVVPYHGQPHLLAVCRDITERKRADEALRRSEAYLAAAQLPGPSGRAKGGAGRGGGPGSSPPGRCATGPRGPTACTAWTRDTGHLPGRRCSSSSTPTTASGVSNRLSGPSRGGRIATWNTARCSRT